jgi:predicted 2-oxoglutarate/Fe(II)-dependent dioxygenase YbiX
MHNVLFTKEECEKIKRGIESSPAGSKDDLWYRKYEEFLILDREILDLVLEKIKVFGVYQLREGRILKYEKGCFFNLHTDTYDKHPDRYKTIIIQLSNEEDYRGGKVCFGDDILDKKIGTTAIFDSTTIHGMEIIESGTRYSFVIWLERQDLGIEKTLI